ncbi:O-antigen ligase family protein [Crateriforma conspicua]|uniref:O-antigen ligase family protein n=1 Tax=Crateriforma conspicua TaxID=2527996 RepID=UPI00118C89D7|nr:O-antigen ligase family protein [Crateriforma conspicua]QDV64730.1 O-Antigen ligase [Crateriforma conspicua]
MRQGSGKSKRRPADPAAAHGAPASASPWVTSAGFGLLAFTLVFAHYFPADSTAVESGDALWVCLLAILAGWAGWWSASDGVTVAQKSPVQFSAGRCRTWIPDLLIFAVAGWIVLASWQTSPPGNLRMASNEAWWWVAAAVWWTGARRLTAGKAAIRRLLILIVIAISLAGAVEGLHQQWISLPADRARYAADPESVLAEVGIDAPPGSAQRMAFENRLNDGGPIGTFALANSFAAQLLVGLVLSVAVLVRSWNTLGHLHKAIGLGGCAILVLTLVATGSRSGMAAGVLTSLAAGCISLNRAGRQNNVKDIADPQDSGATHSSETVSSPEDQTRSNKQGSWQPVVIGIGVLIVVTLTAVVAFGRGEWVRQAPMSLAFRFQYWRSTAAMALDHPWFGAGPGNFQSLYERYREPSANEQIAEPHNFLMETLGAGGFLAAALLIVWFLSLLASQRHASAPENRHGESNPNETLDHQVVMGGFLAGVILCLMSRWVIGASPAIEAVLASVVLAGGWFVAMRAFVQVELDDAVVRSVSRVAIAGLLLHLTVSGGWTVPGVALAGWTLAALAFPSQWVPRSAVSVDPDSRSSWNHPRLAIGVIGMVLVCGIGFGSIRPVTQAARLSRQAEFSLMDGRVDQAWRLLNQAVDADPWDFRAALSAADASHWRLILAAPPQFGGDAQADRVSDASAEVQRRHQQWKNMVDTTLRRSGVSPSVRRVLAGQSLHVYQRFGFADDLSFAAELLNQSTAASPSHQWHWAQLAAVRQAMGDQAGAERAADTADTLSKLGNNYQRWLDRQFIYLPKVVGDEANFGPQTAPASEVLQNLLDENAVSAKISKSSHSDSQPES